MASHSNTSQNLSLADILRTSVTIDSKTIVRQDGRTQSYCGLRLSQINLNNPGPSRPPNKSRASFVTGLVDGLEQNPSLQVRKRKPMKTPNGAALCSAGYDASYISLGPSSYECTHCNATMWYEERSNKAKNAKNPTFSLCCLNGKVRLPKYKPTPQPLHDLLNYDDPATAKFRDQIRVYNSMFGFTSFGARIDHSVNTGRGPYTFRINGQNYHRIGSLLPKEGVQPRFAQLWFFDTTNEVRNRMGAFIDNENGGQVDRPTLQRLLQMLDQYSAIAKS